MKYLMTLFVVCMLLSQGKLMAYAESEQTEQTTADKLEALKKEVLNVNRDLFILEEDLLFPASTQLAVYLSIDVGQFFQLDHVKIKIDDKDVTHYLYTENDVDALHRGAIQKLYLGNLSTGKHQIVAILIGIGPHNREYRNAVAFDFEKGSDAKSLEIQIRDNTTKQQPDLKVIEW
ncbi:AraC family transcriptional regulator [Aliikangiella maris]|uniref:AraC family transcriptional regulator n=2 Tax=Aliikangiella maris TaxID=3162458 RepID=A0ABV3MI31_9GAMM